MSAPRPVASDAIASELVAALEQYERDTGAMLQNWPDIERYRAVSDQVECIRMYSASLPEVRVQWVELLVAHAELIHFLWRMQYGNQPEARAEIGRVREHHGHCIAALKNRARRVLDGLQQRRLSSPDDAPPRAAS